MSSQQTTQIKKQIQGNDLLDLLLESHNLIAELEKAVLWESSPVLSADLQELSNKIKSQLATIDKEIQDIIDYAKHHHSGYVTKNSTSNDTNGRDYK